MDRVTGLLVFGDSLSDVGNAHALRGDAAFPCPPHWQGRRCNGPLWVELLAEGLGLPPLVHSGAGGRDYAFGGARSGEGMSPKGVPNLLTQVEGFLSAGGSVEPGCLVVVRAGANDYLDTTPTPAVGHRVNQHLFEAVERLCARGLRQFLVPSELPWGHSPIQLPGLGEQERHGLNGLITRQNANLREELEALAARRELTVAQPDAHALFLAVRAAPAAHGFTEIERPALVNEPAREPVDAAGHLWWDPWAHLTSAFHRCLAVEALQALGPAADLRRSGVTPSSL